MTDTSGGSISPRHVRSSNMLAAGQWTPPTAMSRTCDGSDREASPTKERVMTSPVRQRRTRSRRRISDADAAESLQKARALAQGRGSPVGHEPLTRNDCVMIRKAVNHGWPIPHHKQIAIVARLVAMLDDPRGYMQLCAVQTIVAIDAAGFPTRTSADEWQTANQMTTFQPGNSKRK